MIYHFRFKIFSPFIKIFSLFKTFQGCPVPNNRGCMNKNLTVGNGGMAKNAN